LALPPPRTGVPLDSNKPYFNDHVSIIKVLKTPVTHTLTYLLRLHDRRHITMTMASSLPIPAPPRTPTPPTPLPDDEESSWGLGKDNNHTVRSTITFDPNSLDPTGLSPWSETFGVNGNDSNRFGAMNSSLNSPTSTVGELRTDGSLGPPPAGGRNPFNFQTQTIKDTPVIAKSVCQANSTSRLPTFRLRAPSLPFAPIAAETENRNYNQLSVSVGMAQTFLSVGRQQAEDDKYTDGPSLRAQSGNTYRRSGTGGNPARATGSNHRPFDDCPQSLARRQLLSSLTPPTDTHPYRFPTIDLNKQNIGQRRGHRYKHSSVSTQHQIFLEPPPRPPLALPASLPIPTYRETLQSLSREQYGRACWCVCHFMIAGIVHHSGDSSAALTALSHLIFFDASSALLCVIVDISHNFEVWKRASIRHPFGLQRAEVLAGFAMSIFLLFMAFDLISHNLKHVLESLGSHTPHHPHSHQRVLPGAVDLSALLSVAATLISAYFMKNHARISKAMRIPYLSSLPSLLSTPSHFLTLFCSVLMLILPLLSVTIYAWMDRLLCAIMAISMFVLGFHSAGAQGVMLLMSYKGDQKYTVKDVIREIKGEGMVMAVDEARFWQVHYGLAMANLKLRVKGIGGAGEEAALLKLRERVALLVRKRLGGEYGRGSGLLWEVTIQMDVEGRS